ncbi:hypothetical protein FS837_010964 [Tulasnella sp. UAMH 9824]|nr:hypothetical protein FS837_010964 [Tulasnella sp. UAMH 9824]
MEHMQRIITDLPDLDRLSILSSKAYGFGRFFTPAILETIAMRSQLLQLAIPLNALEVPWISETLTPTAKFDVLVKLSLKPLHIEPSAIKPFTKYLAQLCPSARHLQAMILHSNPTDTETEERYFLTNEEVQSCRLIERLFFDARKEYEVSGSAKRLEMTSEIKVALSYHHPERMHIFDLPVEIFTLILKLLTSRDLLRCATVQYRWVTKHSSTRDAVASAGWRRLNELQAKITRLRVQTHLISDDIDYIRNLQHAVESAHHAFFPNLRQLDVIDLDPSGPYMYDFLPGSSLQQFKLDWAPNYGNEPAGVFEGVINSVALRSPMVRHIKVFQSEWPFIDYGKFSQLQTLDHAGDFSVTSWRKLCAGCPLLEKVNIWWTQERLAGEDAPAFRPQTQELPALRVLNLVAIKDSGFNSYILRTTIMPQLRDLRVDLEELESREADGLLSLIGRHSPLISALRVTGSGFKSDTLGSFSRLQNLELYGRLSSWAAKDVEHIFESLPNLARLMIATPGPHGLERTRFGFTPANLETMATRCQLSSLQIPLNALEIPRAAETPNSAAEFDRLRSLVLNPLHIEPSALEPLAKYLAQLCPTLDHFEPTVVHPHETMSGADNTWWLTAEERANVEVLESLFWAAQKEYRVGMARLGGLSTIFTFHELYVGQ